jgi:hypothetical protein
MIVAGITMEMLFQKLPLSPVIPSRVLPFQARLKLSKLNLVGSSHIRPRLTSSKLLKAVISST